MLSQLNPSKKFVFYAAGTFCAIVATFIHVEMLIVLTITLFIAPSISHVIGFLMFRGLRCVRESPPVSTTGAEVVVPLKVVNASSLPKFGLQVRDTLPASFAVTGSSVQLISSLLPGETATLTYGLVPAVRGVYTLGPLEFRGTDPLGLTRFSSSAQEWTSLVVYPRPLEMGKLQTHWHGLRNWSQNEGGRTRGIGGEFFGVREYVFGDEPKHVHWRSTAKRGKLVVSESARGDTGTVAILLDCGLIWDTDTADPQSCPFERAIVATITVAMCFIQGGCPVLLVTGDRGQTRQPLADSIQPLQDALARVQPQAQNDIAAAIDSEAVLIDQASVLFCFTSDQITTKVVEKLRAAHSQGTSTVTIVFESKCGGPSAYDRRTDDLPGDVFWVTRGTDLQQILQQAMKLNHAL